MYIRFYIHIACIFMYIKCACMCITGRYQEALEEHEQEFKICDDLDDTLGKAIASRKLGECYMDLGEFEPALSHITQYRTLAESTGNKEEMQRAFVTIGRLHLTQCSSVTHHKKLQSR